MTEPTRQGEYQARGDYHLQLDPDWSYTPLYKRKVELVDRFVTAQPGSSRLLDVGAGEGLLVERYRRRGYSTMGVDPHYSSELVQRASILSLPYDDGSFEAVLCLVAVPPRRMVRVGPRLTPQLGPLAVRVAVVCL